VAGGSDVLESAQQSDTSYPVASLPAGAKLYVRLWTKFKGTWRFVDSTFTSAPAVDAGSPRALAAFLQPLGGAAVGTNVVFQWTQVPCVLGFHLHVGTSPGADDVGMSPDYMPYATFTVGGLPRVKVLYVRLYTQYSVGDWDHYVDIVVTTSGP